MRLWSGSPIDDDQHERFPWWRKIPQFWGDSMGVWTRLDGRTARTSYDFNTPAYPAAPVKEERLEAIARIDREHLLEAPRPMPGQCWVWPDCSRMVTGVDIVHRRSDDDGKTWWLVEWGRSVEEFGEGAADWPPPGAVLVSGPSQYSKDTQWAPAPEVADE